MNARDVANLIIVFVPACTVGICLVIVGIPIAEIAFGWSPWAGVGVILAVLAFAISPMARVLAILDDDTPKK